MSRPDEPARDRRLEAALRHAPDREVAVPPLLRARIVAAAHRDAEASRQRRPWWRRLDAFLTPRRMGGVGTAAAAVLAATVLWVGRDEQPSAPDPRPAPVIQPQTGTERTPSTSSAVVTPSAPSATPQAETAAPAAAPSRSTAVERDAARQGRQESAPAAAPTPSARRDTSRDAEVGPTRISRDDAAGRAATAQAAGGAAGEAERAALEARKADLARQATAAEARATITIAPQPAPVPERPTPFADAAPPAVSDARRAPAPPAGASDTRERTEQAAREQLGSNTAGEAMRQIAPAPQPPGARRPAAAAPATPSAVAVPAEAGAPPPMPSAEALRGQARNSLAPLPGPMAETWLAAADPAAWRRRAPGVEEALIAPGWLPAFVSATRGRWAAVPTSPATAEGTWTLIHPDGRTARLTWMPGAVIVCDLRVERCEQARLDEATQEALRQGLRR